MFVSEKCLIYQYWTGKMPSGTKACIENTKKYAHQIGADYRFDKNPNFSTCSLSRKYDALRPVYDDTFNLYDKVLYLDLDVFAVDKLKDSIFNNTIDDIGMCEEEHQPALRARTNYCGITSANDKRLANIVKKHWGIELPRDTCNRPRVFNSGVVLYSKEGMIKARKVFVQFQEYINTIQSNKLPRFYTSDQNYLRTMINLKGIKFTQLPSEWNSQISWLGRPGAKKRPIYDGRTDNTKFVHIQLSGADNYDAKKLWRITNLPQCMWDRSVKWL